MPSGRYNEETAMKNTQLSDLQRVPPEVALIFPPLVETNFGSYYPSTAVLAGYLASVGILSVQAVNS